MTSRLDRVARHRRVLAGAAAFVALGVAVSTVPAVADSDGPAARASASVPPNRVTWPSGAYSGASKAETNEFARWRGRATTSTTQFQGSSSRADMANVDYLASQFAGNSARIVLSTAFWPQNEQGSLALAARGAYDGIYTQLARNLVAKGMGRTTLRMGWEFNGDYFPWQVRTTTDAKNFAASWRRAVNAMRKVPGQRFTFDWSPVIDNYLLNPELSWPGSAYVDYIGMSVYNYTPNALQTAPNKRFHQLLTWRYGLQWQLRFATKHRKKVAYSEWGTVNRPFSPAYSSGDDPYFIGAMFNWFRKTQPAYENYFDSDSLPSFTYYGLMSSGVNPQAAAEYRRRWGPR